MSLLSVVFFIPDVSRVPTSGSAIQPLAGRLVEQMHERRVRLEPDLVARRELVALAEHGDDLLASELGEHLGFRAGRLDHDNLSLRAVVGDGEMLGTDAINHRLA